MKKSIKKIIIPVLLVFVFLGAVLFFMQKERGCQKVYIKDGDLVVYSDPNKILEWQNHSPEDEWAEVASDANYYLYEVTSLVKAHGGNVIYVDNSCVDVVYHNKNYHLKIDNNSSVENYFYPKGEKIYTDYFEIEGVTVFADFKKETPRFNLEIKTHCIEGFFACDYVILSLFDKEEGIKKSLKGNRVYKLDEFKTRTRFLGYLFKDEPYEYFITNSEISIKKDGEEIIRESFVTEDSLLE